MLKKIKWLIPFMLFFLGYFMPHIFFKIDSIEVPNVLGKQSHEALTLLGNAQINSRVVCYKEDQTLPAGTVLTQIPAPGQSIKPHQTIFLTISNCAAPLTTPSYIGQPLTEDTIKHFKKQAIKFKKICLSSTTPQGNCIAQIPSPNTISLNKSLILYIASQNNSQVIFPNFEDINCIEVTQFLTEKNIPYKIIHSATQPADHDCTTSQCIVFEQRPLAGSFINLQDPISVSIKVKNLIAH